jgi:Ca-activated chloride channel family protein
MNAPHFSPDDPQLTAYALGELDETERQQVEARLRDDPAARATVETIRATAAQLEAALASEPLPAVKPPAADPYRQRKAKVFSFPRFYYVAGGLAAACFAVLVVRHEPRTVVTESVQYTEVNLPGLPQAVAEPESAKDGPELTVPRISAADAMAEVKGRGYGYPEMTRGGGIMLGGRDKVAVEVQTVAPDKNAALAAVTPVPHLGYGVTLAKAERGRPGVVTFALTAEEPPMAAEAYAHVAESGFLRVSDHPLSTFSIDVDTASYANVRRFLTQGRRPPVDAVRIEELLNYFPYNYAAPKAKNRDEGVAAPFAASMEVAEAPWAPEHRLVRIGLKGREVTLAARPAANLVFLLDVSGSMSSSNKLPLVKESLRLLMDKLRADDRVAIVTYAGNSGTGVALDAGAARRRRFLPRSTRCSPGGSTNGAMGIHLAYDIAKANFVSGRHQPRDPVHRRRLQCWRHQPGRTHAAHRRTRRRRRFF